MVNDRGSEIGLFTAVSELHPPKQPHLVLTGSSVQLYAFSPNRETLGGTAYLIVKDDARILVDCPAWNEANQTWLQAVGSVQALVLTHRGGMARVSAIQAALGCAVLVQEQEAYLIPETRVTVFQQGLQMRPDLEMIWTPGHSPGSACVYLADLGGVLFSGRHLLPDPNGSLVPWRTARTFHWRRQQQSVARLQERFTAETLAYICPGAHIGFLRGERVMDRAYERLSTCLPGA